MEKINYNVYRGSSEPILKVYKSEVTLHKNHVELVAAYDYRNPQGETDRVRYAVIIPKSTLSISRTFIESDPIVELISTGSSSWIRCTNDTEADSIYLKMTHWLLK